MNNADVTICIPTFNQASYLCDSLQSALNQTVSAKAIIVCDDASTDETPNVMRELTAVTPQLLYERNPVNLGIAGNNSRLMALAKTEYIIRLDSDDLLEPRYIEQLMPLMLANPKAGYGHVAIKQIDQDGKEIGQAVLHRRTGFQDADNALKAAVKGYRVAANIVIYRRAAIEQLNFFRDRPEFVEDYDMAARLAAAGWGNVYCEQLLARYRIWTDTAGTRSRRKHLQLSGYCRIYDEVLKPAFNARGWSTAPIDRQRKKMALIHANACFMPPYTEEDRGRLIPLLRRLGGHWVLEVKLIGLRCGLAETFERAYHLRSKSKMMLKRWFSSFRRVRSTVAS
jgi:GT2 family glycosyltransferase